MLMSDVIMIERTGKRNREQEACLWLNFKIIKILLIIAVILLLLYSALVI